MNYEYIVIGSGLAGLSAAYGLHHQGKKVAVIENSHYGGVVNNTGSTRKKELVTVAEHLLQNKRFEEKGITNALELNWTQTMNWINSLEDTEDSQHELELNQAGIETIYGTAEFLSKNDVSVDGIVYSADHFIIATGGKDRPFSFSGSEFLSDSSEFLTQKKLPKELIFVGAGIISFAFMTIASAFNATIHVIQHDGIALKDFDQEFVEKLIEINKKRGVTFHFNESISELKQASNGRISVQTSNGNLFEVDKIYNVAGRVPAIDQLQLEKAEVEHDQHGIVTNNYLQTSQPTIFACGDCSNAPVPKLATYAVFQAEYLVDFLLAKNLAPIQYPIAAMSIFSEPRIAQVGVTTAQAAEEPERFATEQIDVSNWNDFRRKAEKLALLKIVIRKSDDRLVGATLISQEADILINYITMGIHAGWTKKELKQQIYAYPSLINELERFWR